MESIINNTNCIIFLLLFIAVMLVIMLSMFSTMLGTIKTIYNTIVTEDKLDTECANLPAGFIKVSGFNVPYYNERYVYVKNFISDDFFIYDTKTGQLVKVNLNPDRVSVLRGAFE